MAIIAPTFEAGTIEIAVASPGMKTETLVVQTEKQKRESLIGLSVPDANQHSAVVMGKEMEIPVRKLEIVSHSGQLLTAENSTLQVKAALHPENISVHC